MVSANHDKLGERMPALSGVHTPDGDFFDVMRGRCHPFDRATPIDFDGSHQNSAPYLHQRVLMEEKRNDNGNNLRPMGAPVEPRANLGALT